MNNYSYSLQLRKKLDRLKCYKLDTIVFYDQSRPTSPSVVTKLHSLTC